ERRGGRGLAPHGGGDGGSGRSTASSPQVAALQEELRLQTSRLVESWAAQADTAAGCAPERRVAGAVSKETRGDDHPSSAEAEIRLLQEQVGRSSAELRRQEQRESELRREVERLTTQLERLRPAAGPGERRQSAAVPVFAVASIRSRRALVGILGESVAGFTRRLLLCDALHAVGL
ncbi:unnamed protein product, partial [Prorocentrum cordatum]